VEGYAVSASLVLNMTVLVQFFTVAGANHVILPEKKQVLKTLASGTAYSCTACLEKYGLSGFFVGFEPPWNYTARSR
jgi:hypothetical protein